MDLKKIEEGKTDCKTRIASCQQEKRAGEIRATCTTFLQVWFLYAAAQVFMSTD